MIVKYRDNDRVVFSEVESVSFEEHKAAFSTSKYDMYITFFGNKTPVCVAKDISSKAMSNLISLSALGAVGVIDVEKAAGGSVEWAMKTLKGKL